MWRSRTQRLGRRQEISASIRVQLDLLLRRRRVFALSLLSAFHHDDAKNIEKMLLNISHFETFMPFFPARISGVSGKVLNCFQRAHLLVFTKTEEEEKKRAVIHFVIQAFTLFLPGFFSQLPPLIAAHFHAAES